MKPHELRLIEQHCRNARHLSNLQNFVADRYRFSRLSVESQSLLLKQIEIQTELDQVLVQRMKTLNLPV